MTKLSGAQQPTRDLGRLLVCRRWGTPILSTASRAERQPSRDPVTEPKQARYAMSGRALLVANTAHLQSRQ
jgi:hypothetical protein